MVVKNGGPAFPLPGDGFTTWDGMTLRDYFAAAALQGMLAYSHVNPSSGNWTENSSPVNVAAAAYDYADAMLKAMEETR